MKVDRKARIGEQIRVVLGEAIAQLEDPRLRSNGLLTITYVEVTGDLRHARVGFVVHAGDERTALSGLISARGLLRKRVGQAIVAKATPELMFEPDRSFENAERVQRLLDENDAEPAPAVEAPRAPSVGEKRRQSP